MTPTPQERTELQRLAEALELAGNVADEAWQMGLNVRAAKKLASALLSLAAQSEELRAELEKERAENVQQHEICRELNELLHQETNSAVGSELATSKMWRRRALDAENRADQADADCLALGAELKQWREGFADTTIEQDRRYEALESRYTALEKALQHFLTLTREFHPGDTPEDAVWLVPDSQLRTLSAALTPKEGE